jgi:hypothetical protein
MFLGRRLRGADVRDHLVPEAAAGAGIVGDLDRGAARARSWPACASAASRCAATSGAGRHPLRVYAVLELAIAASGLLMLVVMPLVQRLYTAIVPHGVAGLMLRGLFAAICLLPARS